MMTEELASTLNEDERYFIYGKKYTRLDRTKTYILVDMTYFAPEPRIQKDQLSVLSDNDVFTFKIGIFLTEVDSINNVNVLN